MHQGHLPADSAQPARPGRGDWWRAAALTLWLIPLLVITGLVIARPRTRTVTATYQRAVQSWWTREPLYRGPTGMNYLPHFAVLHSPYRLAGPVLGGVLWRWTGIAGLAAGLWLFSASVGGSDRWRSFTVASALSLPLILPAVRNGQANAHFGAALLLAAWCLHTHRWGVASALLWLAVGIKPLGTASLALAWAAYPPLGVPLLIGLPVFLAFPFFFAGPGYVWDQYVAAWANLRQCAEVTEHRFADLNGLLRTFGVPLTGRASFAVRAIGGALLMLVSWRASRIKTGPPRALVWLSMASGFLMVFNPMTEANSYVILAPALGLVAWWEFNGGARALGWVFMGMALTMGLLPNLLRPWLGNSFALAYHPAMTLAYLALVAARLFAPSLAVARPTSEPTAP